MTTPYFNHLKQIAKTLSTSQGFYTRLYAELKQLSQEDIDTIENVMSALNLTTDLDIILWLEQ